MNKYEIFVKWCNNNGARLQDLSLETYKNNERGIHTTHGIRKGKTIIEIPEKLIIHDGMGEKTTYGQLIKNHSRYFNNIKIVYVMLYILQTHKNDSFFKSYYDILPRNVDNFPIFWNKENIALMTGSNVINEIITRQNDIMNDYNKICEIIIDFKKNHSIREFIWVRSIVGSRNFGITIDNTHRVAMVPISDMLNHDANPDVHWGFYNKTRTFKMISNRYLKKNNAITDTYGKKSNIKYLLFYGFTIQNNYKYDVLYIHLVHGTNNIDLKNDLKKNVAGYLNVNVNSTLFHEILLFLRISISNRITLTNNRKLSYYEKPISIEHEKLAVKSFIIYLKTLVKNYKYFNRNSKNNYEKFSIKWNCYNLIMGEINIISLYINYLHNVKEVLEGNKLLLLNGKSTYFDMLKGIM